MPVLELVIDARKAEQGARQAETALRGVTAEATKTQQSIGLAGQQVNTAFSATSGGLSFTRGIASTAQALQQGSAAAAGFAASTALLDVSRLANDFSALRASTGGTTTVMGTLASVLKSHPLLIIGTALAAASTLMSAFSSNTKDAASAWDTLGATIGKAKIDEETALFLGISPKSAQQSQLDAIAKLVSEQRAKPTSLSINAISSALGTGRVDVLAELNRLGNADARSIIERGSYERSTLGGGQLGPVTVPSRDIGAVKATPEQIRQLLGDYYRNLVKTQSSRTAPTTGPNYYGGTLGPLDGRPFNEFERNPIGGVQGQGVLLSTADQARVAAENTQRAADAAAERMDELVQKGREFGATIGDAFFNVASGTQTARQAIQGLILDLARAASREVFSGIAAAAVKGLTQNQATNNATPEK